MESIEGLPDGLRITSCGWPDDMTGRKPGDAAFDKPRLLSEEELEDLLHFDPEGNQFSPAQYACHPVLSVPQLQSSGGTVYFESRVPEDLYALIRVLGIDGGTDEYAAFAFRARNPNVERYLIQLKLVTFAALKYGYFRYLKPYDKARSLPLPPKQSMSLAEAMVRFVECQAEHWLEADPGRGLVYPKLFGLAGGEWDGDFECLGFGLHVEKPSRGVYRIWSRAWLAGK